MNMPQWFWDIKYIEDLIDIERDWMGEERYPYPTAL